MERLFAFYRFTRGSVGHDTDPCDPSRSVDPFDP